MKNRVIEEILDKKIIAILRGVQDDKLIPLCEALYRGGIRLLEITYSQNGRVRDEDVSKNIKRVAEHFEGKMFIGAGTVLTEKQVELTYLAGGKFIISPDTSEEVIGATLKRGLVSIPGALTPTEIQKAHSLGADFVKLFPISTFGPDYVKAVSAPLSGVKMLAVGGIDENNMAEYFKAGVLGIGVGSNITPKAALNSNDYETITTLAEKYVLGVKKCLDTLQ